MASILSWLRERGPDWRPRRKIEDEVKAELRFHLEEATDEGVRNGLTLEAARAAALARFGDVEAIAARCVEVREHGAAQMIKYVVTGGVVLLAVSTLLIVRAQRAADAARDAAMRAQADLLQALAAERDATQRAREALERASAAATGDDPALWLARFRVEPDNWRLGWAVAQELVAALEPDQALSVMREVFPLLEVESRKQVLKPFVFHGGHPRAIDVLDLAWRDPDFGVRERARGYLREYAFTAFADRDPRYDAWLEASRSRALSDTFTAGLRELVARLKTLKLPELRAELSTLEPINFQAARKAGVDVASTLKAAGFEELLFQLELNNLHSDFDLRPFRAWLVEAPAPESGEGDAK